MDSSSQSSAPVSAPVASEKKANKPAPANRHPVALALVALAAKVDRLKLPAYVETPQRKGESTIQWAMRIVREKEEHEAKHGDGKQAVRDLLNAGFSEIFEAHGLKSTAGRPKMPTAQELSEVKKEEARKLIKSGKSADDIASAYGVTVSSVRKEFGALFPKE